VTFRVEFSAEAEEELDVAAVWFDEQRPGLGSEFLEAIEEILSLLTVWPRTGSIIEDTPANLEIRRAPVSRFRFYVGYLVLDDRVRVLAVAHHHRKPGYWHQRVGRGKGG
jgi:plasmid stabilization system protein ParE